MSKIQAILFDFGGTLDSDGVDWFERFYRAVAVYDTQLTYEVFDECSNWVSHYVGTLPDTAQLSMGAMVARLYEYLHQRLSQIRGNGESNKSAPEQGGKAMGWDYQELADAFMAESTRYLQRNRQVLAKLRRRYRLGVISNNWGNAAGWCEEFALSEFCDTMIDSTVVGAAKPDPAIFQVALEELGLPGSACAYVGDKYEADVQGAHRAGMLPIWIVGKEPKACPDPTLVGRRIERLTDLPDLDL